MMASIVSGFQGQGMDEGGWVLCQTVNFKIYPDVPQVFLKKTILLSKYYYTEANTYFPVNIANTV